jgi:hypothetical protein
MPVAPYRKVKKKLTNLGRIWTSSRHHPKNVVCRPLDLTVIICWLRHIIYRGSHHLKFLQWWLRDYFYSQQQRWLFVPVKFASLQYLTHVILRLGKQHLSQ